MDTAEIKNAIIKSAVIDIGDRDMLTAWLYLDYGGAGQGFGGLMLLPSEDSKVRERDERGPNFAGVFIDQCLRVAGVNQWSELPGKAIRVQADHCRVHAIGHLVENRWFCPAKEFQALTDAAARPAP